MHRWSIKNYWWWMQWQPYQKHIFLQKATIKLTVFLQAELIYHKCCQSAQDVGFSSSKTYHGKFVVLDWQVPVNRPLQLVIFVSFMSRAIYCHTTNYRFYLHGDAINSHTMDGFYSSQLSIYVNKTANISLLSPKAFEHSSYWNSSTSHYQDHSNIFWWSSQVHRRLY